MTGRVESFPGGWGNGVKINLVHELDWKVHETEPLSSQFYHGKHLECERVTRSGDLTLEWRILVSFYAQRCDGPYI